MRMMAPPMRSPAGRSQQDVRVFGTIGPMVSELTDVQVASGFRAGNDDSLAEAYRRWSRLVHATAMRSTGDAEGWVEQALPSSMRSHLSPGSRGLAEIFAVNTAKGSNSAVGSTRWAYSDA